jgi:hypothetical protein
MTLVSDGCICHVSLRVPPADIIESHDGDVYRLLEKVVAGDRGALNASMRAEESVDAARKRVMKLVTIGMRTLLSMEKLPDLITCDDHLELRLLLCRNASPQSTTAG